MAHILGGVGHGKSVEEEIEQRLPGRAPGTPSAPSTGDRRWVLNSTGEFWVEEIWALGSWKGTGNTRSARESDTAGAGQLPRTQFPSERELQEAQAEELRGRSGESEADRAAAEELERMRDESAQKISLQNNLTALFQTAERIKAGHITALGELEQAALEMIGQNVGIDPVRQSAITAGATPRGITGTQAATSRAAVVGQEAGQTRADLLANPATAPNLEGNIPNLQQQIEALQSAPPLQIPTLQGRGSFGLEHGGEIIEGEVLSTDGKPRVRTGGVGFSVMVGEEGGFTGDEEILNFDESGRLEDVRPLATGRTAMGAQEGFDAPTSEALSTALAPVWRSLGLDRAPRFEFIGDRRGGGQRLTGGGSAFDVFNTLGIKPRLIRSTAQRAGGGKGARGNFWVSPSGELIPIGPDVTKFGFNAGDFAVMTPEEIAANYTIRQPNTLGTGGDNPLLDLVKGSVEPGAAGSFPSLTAGLFSPDVATEFAGATPTAGAMSTAIPAPRFLAGIWRSLEPATQRVITSAMQLAGISPEGFEARRRAFTPIGTAGAGVRFG